jgi:alpha-tubulin suppressor-like RCC1 family protein
MNLRPNFSGVPFHTVMVSKDRKLYAWGQNNSGQLGLGHEHDINTPNLVSLPSPSPVVDLGLGGYHTLVALENGEVYAWGRNDDGQLGLGDEEDRLVSFSFSL